MTETTTPTTPADQRRSGTRILVIDNYDSFVYTLVGYLRELDAEPTVVRNDDRSLEEMSELAADFDGVLISPGPGAPADAGVSVGLIRWCERSRTPMLGVCLGHQGLAEAFGASVVHAQQLMHGKTSPITHTGHASFADLPETFVATRYHSLVVDPETVPMFWRSPQPPTTASLWAWLTARPRCGACSITPSQCSPRAATACWATGWSRSGRRVRRPRLPT